MYVNEAAPEEKLKQNGEKLADFQLLFKYTNMDLVYEC